MREDGTVRGCQDSGLLHRPDHVQGFGAQRKRGGAHGGEEVAGTVFPNPLHDPPAALQLRPAGQGADELLGVVEGQLEGNFLRIRGRAVQRQLRDVR